MFLPFQDEAEDKLEIHSLFLVVSRLYFNFLNEAFFLQLSFLRSLTGLLATWKSYNEW
jgi:hypothetical protein